MFSEDNITRPIEIPLPLKEDGSYTKQEWFDAAWERAKDQRKALNRRGACSYTPQAGTTGCLLGARLDPAERKRIIFGGRYVWNAHHMVERGVFKVSDLSPGEAASFLANLQAIHDSADPYMWPTRLAAHAAWWGLTVPTGGAR